MAYDLEEQEQLATLKAWWGKYGNLISWLVAAALASYAAWSGWNYYQRSQSAKAAALYEEIVKAAEQKDLTKIARASADMKDRFSRTAYAQMAALTAAKAEVDAADMKAAKAELQWTAEHGRGDDFRAIARLRLAGILLDEKSNEEGLKVLSGEFPEELRSCRG